MPIAPESNHVEEISTNDVRLEVASLETESDTYSDLVWRG
jgi:hypothetical protein